MRVPLAVPFMGAAIYQRLTDLADEYELMCPGRGQVIRSAANRMRPWVARVTALHPTFGFERVFEDAKWEWRAGSAVLRFVLIDGAVYEVSDEKGRRFIGVRDGRSKKIDKGMVELWVSACLTSTF